MPGSDTVVFVPAWNEERSLPAVLAELHAGLPEADVLVIDDGSTDDTAAVAAAHDAIVVSFGENRGLRAGIAAGYQEAFDRGYAFCGRVDADGQHPVDELARLLELVRSDRCDVAVGSRFAEGEGYDADRYAPSPARRLGIGLLQKAMHVRLGRPFRDPTSGLAAGGVVQFEPPPVPAVPPPIPRSLRSVSSRLLQEILSDESAHWRAPQPMRRASVSCRGKAWVSGLRASR